MRTEVGQRARNKVLQHLEETGVEVDSQTANLKLQRVFGNEVVAAALSGRSDEHADMVREQAALASAGISESDGPAAIPGGGGATSDASRDLGQRAEALGASEFGLGEIAMPDRASSMPLADPDRLSGIVRRSSGRALPQAVARRLSMFLGHDMSGVQVHDDAAAAEANSELHSNAFALQRHIFLAAGRSVTDEDLLLHEGTHVRQFDRGQLPTVDGLAVSSPSDAAEAEARNTARRLASEAVGPQPAQRFASAGAVDASGLALRDTLPGAGNATAPTTEGPTAPEHVRLNLGGWQFDVDVPTGTTAGTSIVATPPQSSIHGLTIQRLSVDLGSTFDVRGGSVTASLQVGDYVNAQGITLRVDRGGSVEAHADNIALNVGDLARGTIDLGFSADGLSGRGRLPGPSFHLVHGLTVSGGQLEVSLSTAGQLNGSGELTGNLAGVGPWRLQGQLNEKVLTGGLTVEVGQEIRVAQGVTVKSGHLTGTYAPEATAIEGVANLDVGGFASADLRGSYDLDAHVWGAQGTVTQTAPKTVGEVTISNAVLNVSVDRSVPGPITGELDWAWSQGWQGHVAGTYKPDLDRLDATGTAVLTGPKQVGTLNVTQANGTIAIENNAPKTFTGTASAVLPYQGQDTFRFDVPSVTTDLQALEVSGTGTVTLTRDLQPSPDSRVKLTLLSGGSGTGTVTANQLTTASLAFQYTVADDAGEIGRGGSTLAFTGATGSVDGQVDFSLTNNYGFPERNSELAYFKPGGHVVATVAAGRLDSATVDLPFAVKNPKGSGLVDGTLNGTIRFGTGEVGGTGHGSLAETWPVEVPFGDFQFDTGGTVDVTVAGSRITQVKVNLPFQTIIDGDPALSFTGQSDGDLNLEAATFTGGVTLTLDDPAQFDLEGGDAIELQPGSTATSRITANQLQALRILIQAVYKQAQFGDLANGQLDGTLAMPTALFTGGGTLTLMQDFPLAATTTGGEKPETWAAFLDSGSGLRVDLEQNVPKSAQISAQGHMVSDQGTVARGTLSGDYKVGDPRGLSGNAAVDVVQRIPWSEGGRFATVIDLGTHLDGTLKESRVTGGNLNLQLAFTEGGADKIKTSFSVAYAQGSPLTGSGTLSVVDEVLIASRSPYALNLVPGSGGQASVEADRLTKASGVLKLRLDKAGTPFLDGDLNADWNATVADAPIDANGTVHLLTDFEMGKGTDLHWFALQGSSVEGSIKASELEKLHGVIHTRFDDGGGPFATADLDGTYVQAGETFTGHGEARINREKDLGATTDKGWKILLEAGGSADADIQANALQTLRGSNLKVRVDDSAPLLGVTLDGTYTHASKSFTGTGAAALLRAYELGTAGDYTFFAEPGTGLRATVTANALSEVGGQINASVRTGGATFLALHGEGKYKLENPSTFDFDGAADVVTEKKMASAGGFDVWLLPGTGAKASVQQNQLKSVSGNIVTRVDYQGQQFARVTATNGSWTPEAGVSGRGAAELLVPEWKAAEMGRYSLWLTQGTGAEINLERSAITEITANIPIKIKEGAADFMTGKVAGSYKFAEKVADGSATLTVVQERQLISVGQEQFWLLQSTGVTATVAANTLTNLGGGIKLGLRDGGGQYANIAFNGSFDTAQGRFDGHGLATVEREKRLPSATSPFAVTQPTSAEATIENNTVTKIAGTIGFVVYKGGAGEALLRGTINGDWNAAENLVNGDGDVRLASDQTYGPIVLKAGSGGQAHVVASELREFTGDIHAVLSSQGQPLVQLDATGQFDAVNSKVVHAEGGATMLRPWEPITGLVISDVAGTGKITDNQIEEVAGHGTIAMEKFHATGTIDAKYTNHDGAETYSGDATLTFAWAMEGGRGRGITGAGVAAHLHEDKTFAAEGNVQYAINDKMKGDLGIQIDQNWDPVLSGGLAMSGNLVEGRELFKKEMALLPHQFIPILGPIGVGFGMTGSMGMDMLPLGYTASASIADFHPLHANVPDFEAAMGLTWGMNFFGELAPYIGVGVGIPCLNLTAGLSGAVRLNVPVQVGMQGKLFGRGGEYGGELSMGAAVRPNVSLSVSPFIMAAAFGLSEKWAMGPYPIASMELFSVEWNSKYTFGDAGNQRVQGAGLPPTPTVPAATPMQAPVVNGSAAPSVGGETSSPAQAVDGGPAIGGDDAQKTSGQASGGMDGMMEKIHRIQTVAEGVGAMGRIIDLIGESWNLPVMAYDIATHWSQIEADVHAIATAISTVADMLRPLLPSWWESIKKVIDDGLSALTGAFNLVCEGGRWVVGAVGDALSTVGHYANPLNWF